MQLTDIPYGARSELLEGNHSNEAVGFEDPADQGQGYGSGGYEDTDDFSYMTFKTPYPDEERPGIVETPPVPRTAVGQGQQRDRAVNDMLAKKVNSIKTKTSSRRKPKQHAPPGADVSTPLGAAPPIEGSQQASPPGRDASQKSRNGRDRGQQSLSDQTSAAAAVKGQSETKAGDTSAGIGGASETSSPDKASSPVGSSGAVSSPSHEDLPPSGRQDDDGSMEEAMHQISEAEASGTLEDSPTEVEPEGAPTKGLAPETSEGEGLPQFQT